MDQRIDAAAASRHLGEIMDLAVRRHERFVVDRDGEPAVVILSVQDFIRAAAPPPDWLERIWTGAAQRGVAKLTPDEIDAEIAAARAQARTG